MKVVPQFLLKIGGVGLVTFDVGHNGNESFGSKVALVAVFDLHQVPDHILDVAAILGQI